ncbi:MAG: F0F1 ATP synthase subunit A [Neisseriaceae bacterium]|nr:F0F1 ATP synthase subunit A [Neisseriaceae bacterium]
MSTSNPTPSEYIIHHITNWSHSGHPQDKIVDFSHLNIDTLFWSLFAALNVILILYTAARKASSGVPGRMQGLVEMMVEMVSEQARTIIHGKVTFIAPLALTAFLFIVIMNTFDLIPVDLVPAMLDFIGIHLNEHKFMRVVPTADINTPLGMALAIFFLMIFYGIKIKGLSGFIKELFSAPFGNKWYLWIPNLSLNIIEYVAKTVSLGMRLFGNMFSGELVFLLIAMLGASATAFGFFGHIIAGSIWAIFHILVILLQGYIFMMLTLVYLGQAHDHH